MEKRRILEAAETSISLLKDLLSSIDQDQMTVIRGSGFWSIADHLAHLADTQHLLLIRAEAMARGTLERIVPVDPAAATEKKQETRGLKELLKRFEDGRRSQIALSEKAAPENWQRQIAHPEMVQYSLEIMMRHMIFHDGFHMHRMEELWLQKPEYLQDMRFI